MRLLPRSLALALTAAAVLATSLVATAHADPAPTAYRMHLESSPGLCAVAEDSAVGAPIVEGPCEGNDGFVLDRSRSNYLQLMDVRSGLCVAAAGAGARLALATCHGGWPWAQLWLDGWRAGDTVTWLSPTGLHNMCAAAPAQASGAPVSLTRCRSSSAEQRFTLEVVPVDVSAHLAVSVPQPSIPAYSWVIAAVDVSGLRNQTTRLYYGGVGPVAPLADGTCPAPADPAWSDAPFLPGGDFIVGDGALRTIVPVGAPGCYVLSAHLSATGRTQAVSSSQLVMAR